MECNIGHQDGNLRIEILGEFTFGDTHAFAPILQQVRDGRFVMCDVDLDQLHLIDSSGLRMLLLLHDASKDGGGRVILRRSKGQVREMLLHSRFDTIVSVE